MKIHSLQVLIMLKTKTLQVGMIDTAFSACLWEEVVSSNDTNRPDKGYEFLPRLLYWNKYSPPTVAAGFDIKLAKVQTWSNTFGFLLANACSHCYINIKYIPSSNINK